MPEEENVIAEGKQSIAIGGQVTDSKIDSGDTITEQHLSSRNSHTTYVNIIPPSSPPVVPERKLRFLLLLKPCLKWLLLLPLTVMAINPLLLTMIATVHCFRGALPGRRVELYAEICDVLLGKRQEAKGITEALTAEKKKVVLQVLALELMERNTREFTPELGTSLIQGELIKVAGNNLKAEDFLNNIENLSGLLIEREKDLYEFSHKSFQEYLAAVQIKETNQESILIENINNPWWEETIRLYAAQSDVTNLITAALNSSTVISLKLAYDCLEESLRVTPEVREHLKDRLEDGVESTDSEVAKLAAQVKLVRRLNKLLRLNDNLEIDTSYITHAEYQLFIDDQLKTGKKWSAENAKKPITKISFQDAKRFCVWLTLKAP